jgi:hypothetical protein
MIKTRVYSLALPFTQSVSSEFINTLLVIYTYHQSILENSLLPRVNLHTRLDYQLQRKTGRIMQAQFSEIAYFGAV